MKAALVFAGLSVAHGVTPIQKVLEMMQEMHDKGVAAKQEEEVKFSAFDQWCTGTLRTKQDEIDAGQTKIEELTAQIEKNAVEIRELTDRINELDEDLGRWTKDEAAAQEVRDKEAVDFKATVTDYTESIDALGGAIAVLNKQTHDTAQAEFFLQVQKAKLVPVQAKKALAEFLQQPDELSVSAPEANAYEFQSGGVVDMLEKLLREFKDKKSELEEEELKAQNAFSEIMGQLHNNKKAASNEVNKKTTLRAETEEEKSEAEGEKDKTQQEKGEDQAYRADTDGLCNRKTQDFNARQKLRQEELDAISKAMEIVGSKDVAGAGEKHLPQLIQKSAPALAQLRSNNMSPLQKQLSDFLAERAKDTNSALLAQVAVQAAANPFGKVKKMIKDLISKLVNEATEEAEHKGWCDTELTTNQQTRDKKTEEVNTLNSEIEDLTATIAQLTQDLADLTQALKELADDMAKETAERSENKAKNGQTISDAKAAQTAVEDALAVLKDFYAKAAEATAFSQQKQTPGEDAPETFDESYQGMGSSGGGVVGMLEVILTDFSRLESETSTDEAMEADEFKTFMFESEKDQALKENDMKHKQEKKTQKESALHSAGEELKLTQEALDGANAYYEKLKPTCVDSGITYEERVKRREAEMQSLSEALKILSGTDVDVKF
jgi:DNA repair exonuclease SbcCD ATPase subunit